MTSRRAYRGLLTWAAVIVVAGLVTVAVHRDTPESATTRGMPGTAFANGFVVEPGSRLVGVVHDVYPGSYIALLLVDRAPDEVFDRYLEQFAGQGIALDGVDGDSCGRQVRRFDAIGPRTDDRVSNGMALIWNHAGNRNAWAQHLVLWIGPHAGTHSSIDVSRLPPSGPTGDTLTPTAMPDLPGTGGRISVEDPSERMVVVEGSQLLAPAAPNCDTTGGLFAMVGITGDVRQVIGEYLAVTDAPPTITETVVDGIPTIDAQADSAGGPKVYITASQTQDGMWTAFINESND